MSIIEIKEHEILRPSNSPLEREAIFFYTSLCGTCKLGERMLDIIDSMNNHIPIRKINISYAPNLRDSWRICSVPCLVVLNNGKPEQFEYAMRSVDYLYDILKV